MTNVNDALVRTLLFACCTWIVVAGIDYKRFERQRNKEFSDKLFGADCPFKGEYKASDSVAPTIAISVFVRNKEYALPYFLKCLLDLDYPKDRISLWFVADHNRDNSVEVVENFLTVYKHEYHATQLDVDNTKIEYASQRGDLDWPNERYIHIMKLRQKAVERAMDQWADYAFLVDADNLILNPCTLWLLTSRDQGIVAPMLDTTLSYSNFWCDYNKDTGYYLRSDDYLPIRNREKSGVYQVALVHSAMLIDLTYMISRNFKFWPPAKGYPYNMDDFVVMVYNAATAQVPLYIDNSEIYGYMPYPLDASQDLNAEITNFVHMIQEFMTENPVGIGFIPQRLHNLGTDVLTTTTDIGFDNVYMINLERRPDRYIQMDTKLKMLGIEYEHFHAVDAKKMNESYLDELGVKMLDGYVDPFRDRPLTYGEIGCFLSHYFIWKDIVDKKYNEVVVFEDDVRFEANFLEGLNKVKDDIETNDLDWDLIYIGRKKLKSKDEEVLVEGTNNIVWAGYSYWTVGYLLSRSGAEKLLAGNPLEKMVPVDEYIPIMFDKHPMEKYWEQFPERNLKGYSAEPLLIYPTHYTGQTNYYSDTEYSVPIAAPDTKKDEL